MTTLLGRLIKTPEDKRLFQRERTITEVTELICQLMEEHDVSKAELARRLGTSKANITQMLDGRRNMTLSTISDILFHLACEVRVAAVELEEPGVALPRESISVMTDGEWPSGADLFNKSAPLEPAGAVETSEQNTQPRLAA